jgi:hypothetical protein
MRLSYLVNQMKSREFQSNTDAQFGIPLLLQLTRKIQEGLARNTLYISLARSAFRSDSILTA